MNREDQDLYERFSSVRREDEARVPPISLPSLAAQGRRWGRSPDRIVAAAMFLAAMIAAAVWLPPIFRVPHEGLNREPRQSTASITSWKPATDFLLNTPGRELLQGVPAIGDWHRPAIAPGPGEKHRHSKKQVLPKE